MITDDDRRAYDELARNLATAFAASRFHLGLDHTYRRHIKNSAIPDYWIDLAMKVERDYLKSAGADPGGGTDTSQDADAG